MHLQIGLVDVLREEFGITPGGVLGHSAGEIACGYGDGCFTREQTVLVAYHRGRMCPEHGISGGLMAAVGLGADEAEARLAKHGKASCVVGCDNSPVSTTLSGAARDPNLHLTDHLADRSLLHMRWCIEKNCTWFYVCPLGILSSGHPDCVASQHTCTYMCQHHLPHHVQHIDEQSDWQMGPQGIRQACLQQPIRLRS